MDLKAAIITEHARTQLSRRGISGADLREMLANPDEVVAVRPGRVVVQGIRGFRLLRVFVDVDRGPPEAVTASKIEKYRSKP